MADEQVLATRIRGVLIDLGGVVYVGDTVLSGALEALQRLREARIPMRFITNTTRRSQRMILADLAAMGIAIRPEELLTPSQLARDYLLNRHLSPFLLVHPGLEEDFEDVSLGQREAVVVGDAGSALTYDRLNAAYRKVEDGAELLALAMNCNFLDADGALSLDAGPFVVALEYASGRRATVLGKPSPAFFKLALEGLGCAAGAVAMIGDDAEADVGGGMAAGLHGVIVRTGKYRSGDEQRLDRPPTYIADDLSDAVGWLLNNSHDAPAHDGDEHGPTTG